MHTTPVQGPTLTIYITGRGRLMAQVLGYGPAKPDLLARRSGNCFGLHLHMEGA